MSAAQPIDTRTERDPRWAAVLARDPRADGSFYYSVRTTGVYCRPSCAARHPRPENVAFHATRTAAEQAGFRPCRRCRPEQPAQHEQHAALVADCCRFIETATGTPTLKMLAARAGMSPWHFHRLFKRITGVTPRAYADAHRQQQLRQALKETRTITDAIYTAGYNANSRYYEQSQQVLGMTASAYRQGGSEARIRFAIGECSLGSILIAASECGICAIALGPDPQTLIDEFQNEFANAELIGNDAAFAQRIATVVGFVEAPATGLDLPLDIRGTAFQQRVWQALRDIPAGETASYSDIARRIGRPQSARAVAGACAANRLAVAIPCHRVVRNDGGLSGYRWGVELKRKLLERESTDEYDS